MVCFPLDEIDTSVKRELKKTIVVAKRGARKEEEETDEQERIRKAWDSLQRWKRVAVFSNVTSLLLLYTLLYKYKVNIKGWAFIIYNMYVNAAPMTT